MTTPARGRGGGVVLVAVLLAGCGGPPAGSGMAGAPATACVPVEDDLPAGASLAGMAGAYHLVMAGSAASEVAGGGEAEPRFAEGALTLHLQPEGFLALADASTPLWGTTDVDLEAVGAQPVRDLGAEDPVAPGVLVIESEEASGPSILLRLGSESNRRDETPFDAAYTVLAVHRIDDDGFSGSWRSGSMGRRSDGHFCAWRSDARP